MKRIILCVLACLLLCTAALAEYSPGYLVQPPQEVLDHIARSGNGKGSVSTNDWIQVFGEYDGWILIQYDISASQYRIGWIEKQAMPEGAQVNTLTLSLLDKPYNTAADCDCVLTDDPLNSQKAVAEIPKGTEMTELIYRVFDGWSYVCVTIDGQTMCGFVPSTAPIHG